MCRLIKRLDRNHPGFADVLTGEVVANSEIEGVFLDRESVNSSLVNNILPVSRVEKGAIVLMKMALEHFREPLTHELLHAMHRELMEGSDFPGESIGAYVGDMKVVSGRRLDREYRVVHQGPGREAIHGKMTAFIDWYNHCPRATPFVNAVQGHVHFETLHPFCDGNGRIGRNLIVMGLCRDFCRAIPLAISRAFNSNSKSLKSYYRQFASGLDLTGIMKSMAPLFNGAVEETSRILGLTEYRSKVSASSGELNERQLKVLNKMIDSELRDRFKGGMSNTKYRKIARIGDRTALRDLKELQNLGLLVKTGQLKGTRYYLDIPDARGDLE